MGQQWNPVDEVMAQINNLGIPATIISAVEALLRYHAKSPVSAPGGPAKPELPVLPVPRNIAALAEILHRRCLQREELLGDLASDYAWQMLLALTAQEGRGSALSVSSLCALSGARPTTALRQIAALENEKLVYRVNDPKDGRRALIFLTEGTREKVRQMLIGFCVGLPKESASPRAPIFADEVLK